MVSLVTCHVRQRPARRFVTGAALAAFVTLAAVSALAGERRFFRPVQSTIPAPSFAPAAPSPPSSTSSSPRVAPAEPTLADPPATPASPLTDAPRFVAPGVPSLKTPSLPLQSSPAPAVSGDVDSLNWAALAACESGGNPTIVSSNGLYYGLYQFSLGTWRAVGGAGLPSQASADEQTARAKALYVRSGAGQWPVCGKRLFT